MLCYVFVVDSRKLNTPRALHCIHICNFFPRGTRVKTQSMGTNLFEPERLINVLNKLIGDSHTPPSPSLAQQTQADWVLISVCLEGLREARC